MNQIPKKPIHFDKPSSYQICVQGKIAPNWSDRLEGMTISVTTERSNYPVTTLEGEMTDQAALVGVLNTLYELQLPILWVKCV